MALSVTVSKKSVSEDMPKMWRITLNMTLTDNGVEVLNRYYSVRYRTGDSISAKVTKFIALMQADIDTYKSEQNIFTSTQLDQAVINIEAGLAV